MTAHRTMVAGDSAAWQIGAPDHPAADGWERIFVLAGPTPLTGPISDADELILSTTQSATLAPGRYTCTIVATRPNERKTLESFALEVRPDPTTQTDPVDTRSSARRILDAIDAVLEKRATKGQDEIAIGGRRIKNTSFTELAVLRDRYAAIVAREESGDCGFGQKIYTRWG